MRAPFRQCQVYSGGLERLVDKRTAELQRRTTDLEKAIKELRDTQQQVISLLRNRHGLLVFHREKFRPPLTNESGPLGGDSFRAGGRRQKRRLSAAGLNRIDRFSHCRMRLQRTTPNSTEIGKFVVTFVVTSATFPPHLWRFYL